jgi:alpha-beta hydrolase superfamily lysophospholipase
MEEHAFVDSHGVEVFSRSWPVESPSAIVAIAHGASEHSGRYDRFARALNDAGYAVVAIDHRGHGLTAAGADRAIMGAGGGQAVVDDLHELIEQARSSMGAELPVYLFGHSLGSLMAFAYLVQYSEGLAGGVLCGVAADLDGVADLGALLAGFDTPELRDESAAAILAANNAPFVPARTPYDWLSRDEAEVDLYAEDPLCGDAHPLTFGYLIDLFGVVAPLVDHMADITCPVMVIAGGQDPAAGMGEFARIAAAALGRAGVVADLTVYEDDRHELLNELNRDEVTADIIEWLRTHERERSDP